MSVDAFDTVSHNPPEQSTCTLCSPHPSADTRRSYPDRMPARQICPPEKSIERRAGIWTTQSKSYLLVSPDSVAQPHGLCLVVSSAGILLARRVTWLLPCSDQLIGAPQSLENVGNAKGSSFTSPARPARSSESTPLKLPQRPSTRLPDDSGN